jgi:molecular chaperone GrpE
MASRLITSIKNYIMSNKEDKVVQEEEVKEVTDKKDAADAPIEEKKELTAEEKLQVSEDKFLRLFSEFENFRRRTQKEKTDLIIGASVDSYKVLLPILDDFDRAKDNIDNATDIESLKEGINLILDKFTKSLASRGLEVMEIKEKEFNADEHEAITNIPAPTEDLKGKVIDVVEKGYKLNGKVIRFPKVVVGA